MKFFKKKDNKGENPEKISKIEEDVMKIVVKHIDDKEISTQRIDPEEELRFFGLDSLRQASMIGDLEKTFAISFPKRVIGADTFKSVSRIVQGILNLKKST